MIDETSIRYRWETFGRHLDERGQRLFAAAEARTAGWGGVAAVARITGVARSTIGRGKGDLDALTPSDGRTRRKGGGRKRVAEADPGLLPALKELVEPATLGDPVRPLTWVSKSREKLADALVAKGHKVGPDTVGKELVRLGFLMRAVIHTRPS